MSQPPAAIHELVGRFERNLESYRNQGYNETQLRREFIDPFFEALGWDVVNRSGKAEAYKDVIHEDAISVGGFMKAPDYCFRIGGTRKFFLESKRPSINLKDDPHPAYQLRRYAWSAKLPLSILTDFEEFAVYDCRTRPVATDKPATRRTLYVTYKDYLTHWDEIASVFSKDAIEKGSFDKYAVSERKRGTATVDEEFLAEIERWREALAKTLAVRNPKLSVHDLNFAVQRTIDRIIFLRICEDRAVEHYGQLQALLNAENIYGRLKQLYYQADDRYNSGLFHFQPEKSRAETPDELTLSLKIDDKVLKDIIKGLYPPESPYEFSVFPAEILGQVYEQFLGKVIRLTAAHQAKVEEKPEVKKAGGVYYTPAYIVDYIVQHTVGKLCEGKTPKQIEKLHILDPACGSGSFLIGAYAYLLNYHRDWYLKDGPDKHRKELFQTVGGEWRLTTQEKKRILLNNIYGVDIDSQAVEVTKLSLLLKVLEGESDETLKRQLSFVKERALPDLGRNIKCGNSLIGPDYFTGQLLPDEDEMRRVNPFDWKTEFPNIFSPSPLRGEGKDGGGFDAVIGNPPWGAKFNQLELAYHRQKNQEIIVRMIDSFMYFVYRCSQKVKAGGYLGMILPDVILYQQDNERLRRFILRNFSMYAVLNLGDVFQKVTRPACILILEKGVPGSKKVKVVDVSDLNEVEKLDAIQDPSRFNSISQEVMAKIPGGLFITANPTHYIVWTRINSVPHTLLGDLVDKDGIQRGVSPDLKEAFLVDSDTVQRWHLEKTMLRKVLTGGRQVKRYFIDRPDLWVIYTSRDDNFRQLPNIRAHIDQFKEQITCKEVKQRKHPIYSLHRARSEHIFLKPRKFLGVITEDEIIVALDDAKTFATDGLYLFGLREGMDEKYLMAILNSSLLVFIYRLLALETGRVLAQVKPSTLYNLPIPSINFSNSTDKAKHDQMVTLVERMQDLHKRLAKTNNPDDRTRLQRQIDATDREIDLLVFDLYGLTEEEIAIVEGASG